MLMSQQRISPTLRGYERELECKTKFRKHLVRKTRYSGNTTYERERENSEVAGCDELVWILMVHLKLIGELQLRDNSL